MLAWIPTETGSVNESRICFIIRRASEACSCYILTELIVIQPQCHNNLNAIYRGLSDVRIQYAWVFFVDYHFFLYKGDPI